MKKKIVLTLTFLLVLVGCSNGNIMKDYNGFNKKDHHFVTKKHNEILDDLENKVANIYYIGYPECPYCTDLVPVFEDILTEVDRSALYLNPQKDFTQDNAEQYQKFINSLPEKQQNNGVPFIIVIDEDQTVRTFSPNIASKEPGNHKLSENQIEYLKLKLRQVING